MSSKIVARASRIINASPESIYNVIADYRVGHPAILPKPWFNGLTVEKGGFGAGTVIRFEVTVMGRKFPFHQAITEPEPGRVILETDIETGQYSRFTLEPLNGGRQTRVTIESATPASPGLMGFIERLTQPPMSRRMFTQELQNLDDYMNANAAVKSAV